MAKRSARASGNEYQVYVRKWLEERGWTVRNFPVIAKPIFGRGGLPLTKDGKPLFSRMNLDVYGADLVARKGDRLIWIQASMSSEIKKRLAEFSKYFTDLLPGEEVQIWLKKNGGRTNVLMVDIWLETSESKPQLIAEPLGMIYQRKWFSSRTGYTF